MQSVPLPPYKVPILYGGPMSRGEYVVCRFGQVRGGQVHTTSFRPGPEVDCCAEAAGSEIPGRRDCAEAAGLEAARKRRELFGLF